jgi:hypothetical protein
MSCSNNNDGNITISCNGDKVIRKKIGNVWEYDRTTKHSHDYIFINKELHPYQCSWNERGITCLNDPLTKGKIDVVISIDREKGEVWDSFTIYYENGGGSNEIFTGTCEKLNKKF